MSPDVYQLSREIIHQHCFQTFSVAFICAKLEMAWFRRGGQDPNGGRAPVARPFAHGETSVKDRMAALRNAMYQGGRGRGLGIAAGNPWAGTQRAEVTPVAQDVMIRAPADNEAVFEGLMNAAGGVMMSILRLVDVAPFTANVMQNHGLDVRGMIAAQIVCALRMPGVQIQRQQLIQEVMAPELPAEQMVPRDQARGQVERCLRNYNAIRDHAWLMDMIAAAQAAFPENPPPWLARFVLEREHFGWVQNLTLVEMLDYIWHITEYVDDRTRARATGIVLLTVTSFALRGSITHSKLSRLITDLQPVVRYASEILNINDIACTWANFGHLVHDGNMPAIMRRWLGMVPAGAVRLRVLLSQAAGSGLTSLYVIARAIHEHPDFPWPYIARLYPAEWRAAGTAIAIVGGNPYFGFRRDLAEVRSTLFKNLASFCGKLLVAAGDKTLDNKESISRMIESYLETSQGADLAGDMTDEEIGEAHHMINMVANHPSNMANTTNMAGHDDPDEIQARHVNFAAPPGIAPPPPAVQPPPLPPADGDNGNE
ncbi:hypothetical protein UPYG_G00252810 [Umbra pygmaea]|uniref:Nucleoprotein n=1 Tax=Umbra pygmaea TaxID=75934 RepID=A0ABD0WT75_UMBPY